MMNLGQQESTEYSQEAKISMFRWDAQLGLTQIEMTSVFKTKH